MGFHAQINITNDTYQKLRQSKLGRVAATLRHCFITIWSFSNYYFNRVWINSYLDSFKSRIAVSIMILLFWLYWVFLY